MDVLHCYPPSNKHGYVIQTLYSWKDNRYLNKKHLLGGGFKDFLCSPLPGEMIQFD